MTKRTGSVWALEILKVSCQMFHVFTSLLEVTWVSIHPGADVLDRMPFYEGKTSVQKDGSHASFGSEFSKDSDYRNSPQRGKVKTNSMVNSVQKGWSIWNNPFFWIRHLVVLCPLLIQMILLWHRIGPCKEWRTNFELDGQNLCKVFNKLIRRCKNKPAGWNKYEHEPVGYQPNLNGWNLLLWCWKRVEHGHNYWHWYQHCHAWLLDSCDVFFPKFGSPSVSKREVKTLNFRGAAAMNSFQGVSTTNPREHLDLFLFSAGRPNPGDLRFFKRGTARGGNGFAFLSSGGSQIRCSFLGDDRHLVPETSTLQLAGYQLDDEPQIITNETWDSNHH